MKVTTYINGKKHYTIAEAYRSYKGNLAGEVTYITFYKKFVKHRQEHNIMGVLYNAQTYYSEIQVEDFIRLYQFITNYNTITYNK